MKPAFLVLKWIAVMKKVLRFIVILLVKAIKDIHY